MTIPAGRYVGKARPETLCFGVSGTGSEQAGMNIEIMNEGFEGQTVAWFGSFASEKSTEITLRQLRDAGWAGESLTDPTGLGDVEVEVDVRYETFDGKQRMKTSIYPKGGFVVKMEKPLVGAALSALNKKFRGAILQSKRPAPNGAAAKAPAWSAPAGRPAQQWDGQGREPGDDSPPY